MAFVWKFKKRFLWHECFRILVFQGEPRDGIEHTRAPPGIQLEWLFDKYPGVVHHISNARGWGLMAVYSREIFFYRIRM